MKCEMNLTAGYPAGHDARAEWRATNIHGAPFYLCTPCVEAYQKKNPGWERRGMVIVKLTDIESPVLQPIFQP